MTVPARVSWLTDALEAEASDDLAPADLTLVRETLGRDLQGLGAELPDGARLQMDLFKVMLAHRHPERCMSTEDTFVPTPRSCRRAIGIAAVNRCVRQRSAPGVAVAAVLAEGLEDAALSVSGGGQVRAPWWASWYAGLPAGGRAVVCAEAVTWATQLLGGVDWSRLSRSIIGGRDDWWPCPGGAPIVLKGRADVRAPAPRRPALLVVAGGRCRPDWRIELGYPGLVAALGRDASVAPSRVVGMWPQSGQVRVLAVEPGSLRAAADAVVTAVATWVDSCLEIDRAGSGTAPAPVGVAAEVAP